MCICTLFGTCMQLCTVRDIAWCVAQVDEQTEFAPQVRGEIGAFGWHYVSSLPASEEATLQYNTAEGAKHKFYQVPWHAAAGLL